MLKSEKFSTFNFFTKTRFPLLEIWTYVSQICCVVKEIVEKNFFKTELGNFFVS